MFLAAPGEWIWSSLITSDPDTDAAFYQTLFDYEVFELPASEGAEHLLLASDNYARASVNTLPANRPNAHPYWLNYVRVEDAVKMTAKVVALGGRVLVEPRVDRHGGKVAVVADPLGAPFGLLEWPDTRVKRCPSEYPHSTLVSDRLRDRAVDGPVVRLHRTWRRIRIRRWLRADYYQPYGVELRWLGPWLPSGAVSRAVTIVQLLLAVGRARHMRTEPRPHPARCRLFRQDRVPLVAVDAVAVDAVAVADIAD